jgi:hypothetical protein
MRDWTVWARVAGIAWLVAGLAGFVGVVDVLADGPGALGLLGLLPIAIGLVYLALGGRLVVAPSGSVVRAAAGLGFITEAAFAYVILRGEASLVWSPRVIPFQMAAAATLAAYLLGRGRWPAGQMRYPAAPRSPTDGRGKPIARPTPAHAPSSDGELEAEVAGLRPGRFACFSASRGDTVHVSRDRARYRLEVFRRPQSPGCRGGRILRARRYASTPEEACAIARAVLAPAVGSAGPPEELAAAAGASD